MKIFIKNLFLVTFFLGGLSVKSQEGVPYSISLNGGATIFYGDVKEYRFAPTTLHNSEIRPAGELQFRYFMSDYFAFNGTFAFASVSGTDKERDRYFLTNIYEFALGVNLSLDNLLPVRMRDRFNFLIGAQIGKFMADGELKNISDDALITTISDFEEADTWSVVYPVEVAIQYKLNRLSPLYYRNFGSRLYMEVKVKFHFTGVDTVDVAEEDSFSNDIFGVYSLGFVYRF